MNVDMHDHAPEHAANDVKANLPLASQSPDTKFTEAVWDHQNERQPTSKEQL